MNTSRGPIRTFNRRSIVRGALAAAAVVPLSSALAACAGSGSDTDNDSDTNGGTKSADNPFGMAEDSTIDAVIFDGGYGTDYVSFAAAIMQDGLPRLVGEGVGDHRDRPGAPAALRRR